MPTGLRSIIEDVVVDETARRKGIGEALVRHAIELAREAGADGVSLTSNPQREAANQLYQSMGFQLRQTNPYFYKLEINYLTQFHSKAVYDRRVSPGNRRVRYHSRMGRSCESVTVRKVTLNKSGRSQ